MGSFDGSIGGFPIGFWDEGCVPEGLKPVLVKESPLGEVSIQIVKIRAPRHTMRRWSVYFASLSSCFVSKAVHVALQMLPWYTRECGVLDNAL